jgi:hypothetical protein
MVRTQAWMSEVANTAGCALGATGFGLAKLAGRALPLAGKGLPALEELEEDAGALVRACANSFSADTPVETPAGERPIGDLRAGDRVLAWDEASGTVGSYPISDVISHEDASVERLTIDGERLTTTREHPFYSEGRGCVAWRSWLVEAQAAAGAAGVPGRVRLRPRDDVDQVEEERAHDVQGQEGHR